MAKAVTKKQLKEQLVSSLIQLETLEDRVDKYQADLENLIIDRTKELEEAKDMYKTLAKASPVGIFRVCAAGNCVYVNDKWTKITGIEKDDALGFGWTESIHPDDRDKVIKGWNKSISKGADFSMEYRIKCPDGTTVWVIGQAGPVDEGKTGSVGTITDITEEKEILPKLYKLKSAR